MSSKIPGETHPVAPPAPRRGRDDGRRAARRARPEGARAHPDRPYLVLNFATTLDGRAAIAGRSGPIGSDTDTEMLQRLRTRVDAVMIGAGTMRAERYGRIVSDPDFRAYRERTGPRARPARRDRLQPPRAPLGRRPLHRRRRAGRDLHRLRGGAAGDRDAGDRGPPPGRRRARPGARLAAGPSAASSSVLCEGGPTLHGRLREGGLADELFLTIAPKIAGGEGPRILEGALPDVDQVELAWLLESEGELFARYRGMS